MASLRKGGDWNEVEKATNRLVDKKGITKERENMERDMPIQWEFWGCGDPQALLGQSRRTFNSQG